MEDNCHACAEKRSSMIKCFSFPIIIIVLITDVDPALGIRS